MAATDNETNNWFKACLALNITKEGLANFLVSELQKVHVTVGSSCGNCCIETLIPCPTQPYCSKRIKSYCPFHKSQKPQQCFTCDKVKKNITSNHRYNNPSWRNTDAKKWASDYWEIGKCFLPPDGYSSVLSVQESDFNGVISILLNCTHFQNCLSPSSLSPPPPNKQSPLEMVRQIGRDVRHTSDCKVTDADLQGYFQRLSTLLADPKCLLHDHSATIALTRLNDLQNDRMSLKEVCELLKEVLKEADQLKERCEELMEEAKETGEHFSREAERNLAEALQKLETLIQAGEQRIDSKTQLGEQRIDSKTQLGEQRIDIKTQLGEQRIESKVLVAEKQIETKGHDVEQDLERKIKDGTQQIAYHVQDGIVSLQQAANKTEAEDYERGVEDTASSDTSKHPVSIVLNNADQVQCADPRPVLPSVERIDLYDVACSSTWLHSLFSALLTCDHKVVCELNCKITSCTERVSSKIQTGKHAFNMHMNKYNSPSLWKALHGLNIKSLTLRGWMDDFEVNGVESLSQTLSSLKQLETLSFDMYISPILWKALNGLNIKSLTLSCWNNCFRVNDVESLSQTLLSLKQLETLTLCELNYIDIQLPQSLKYVNIYCYALCPTDLRKLAETLSACDQKIEGKLEFGCSCINPGSTVDCFFEKIPVVNYMAILQELKKLNTVAVKRFQIFDRIPPKMRIGDSAWSVRGICDADDDHEDFGNAQDNAYRFITNIDDYARIINRISMRIVISPASIS
ncbi:uncharacterized protein LOC127833604 isoform X2 [Dreissena polymorpha]|uniref:uncharacterized protein LOC127833604 isoform X2 n=1 Tax=Dreissena polymorpha TaxID=45954 RepID=UPI002265616F|nr:uncharacterized protein LOC127833604 isoform X2 [Dreissena polymorpha]